MSDSRACLGQACRGFVRTDNVFLSGGKYRVEVVIGQIGDKLTGQVGSDQTPTALLRQYTTILYCILFSAKNCFFFYARKHILLLINLAQHRTPPAPYLGQGFETIILLANIVRDRTHINYSG